MLLDTSGLLALLDGRDRHHGLAVSLYDAQPVHLTHSYVLAELVALAQSRKVAREKALEFVSALADDPEVECRWVDEELHRAGMALLQARGDKTYSLCDAISFLLMREKGMAEALTNDRHFEQEGFRRLLV